MKKWVVKISEGEMFIVTAKELANMKKSAEEYDGPIAEIVRLATEKDLQMNNLNLGIYQ